MKRAAMNHSKMAALAKRIGGKIIAVGVLESMWHLTAREAPHGDIGKLADDTIAEAIEWQKGPERLITALIDARWVDRHPRHRLVIHDWHIHCDDATRLAVKRSCRPFVGQNPTEPDESPPPSNDGSGSGSEFPVPIDAGAREIASVPVAEIFNRAEIVGKIIAAYPPSNGRCSPTIVHNVICGLGSEDRFTGQPQAAEWLLARVKAYAASPKGRTTPQRLTPGLATWLSGSEHDVPDSAWATKYQGENTKGHGAQAPGKTGENERLKADAERVAAENSATPRRQRPRQLNGPLESVARMKAAH